MCAYNQTGALNYIFILLLNQADLLSIYNVSILNK